MKANAHNLYGYTLIGVMTLMIFAACSKDSDNRPVKEVPSEEEQGGIPENPDENTGADNLKDLVVTGGCKVIEEGKMGMLLYGYVNDVRPSEMGFVYSTYEDFRDANRVTVSAFDRGTDNRRFSASISNIKEGTKYYYYAYVKIEGVEYSANDVYIFTVKYGDLANPYFDFEEFHLETIKDGDPYPFYVWTESGQEWWASGNAGYRYTGLKAQPLEYPSCPDNGGVDGGYCLKLTTRDTGPLGAMVGMRVAAGNLFTGHFDAREALGNTLAATQMGMPFAHKPIRISGFYKYQAGEKMQDKNGREIVGERDAPDIYCVVYKNIDANGNRIQLDGSNIFTSPAIVGIGRIKRDEIDFSNQWVGFNIPIVYVVPVDKSDVKNNLYSTAIVFTSSIRGAEFVGAPGSTLWIDNVKLESEY